MKKTCSPFFVLSCCAIYLAGCSNVGSEGLSTAATNMAARTVRPPVHSGYLWVANENDNSITGYGGSPFGLSFDVEGSNTKLSTPRGIAADTLNGDIYVLNSTVPSSPTPPILIFPSNASGNIAPAERLNSPAFYSGALSIALDGLGNLWAGQTFTGSSVGDLVEFAPGAHGDNVSPIRTIPGSRTTTLLSVQGVATDSSGNVYALALSNDNGAEVAEFSATANGDVPPIRQIFGSHTGLGGAVLLGIAVDSLGDIVVANYYTKSVLVFSPYAKGNAYPMETIHGSNTGFVAPEAVAVNDKDDIWVADLGANAVFSFLAGANGNVSPTTTLSGSGSGINSPAAVAVCPSVPPCATPAPGSSLRRRR